MRTLALLALLEGCAPAPAPKATTRAPSSATGASATPSSANAPSSSVSATASSPATATAGVPATASISAPPPPSASVKPNVKPAACTPQKCKGQGMCDAYFAPGWMWNGAKCFSFSDSGCGLVGPDCSKLAPDEATCVAAHAHCKVQ